MHTRTVFVKSAISPHEKLFHPQQHVRILTQSIPQEGKTPLRNRVAPIPCDTRPHTQAGKETPSHGPSGASLQTLPTSPPLRRRGHRPARRRLMRPSARRGAEAARRPASLPACHAAAVGAEGGCAPPQPGSAPGLQLLGAGALAAGLQPRGGREGEGGAASASRPLLLT